SPDDARSSMPGGPLGSTGRTGIPYYRGKVGSDDFDATGLGGFREGYRDGQDAVLKLRGRVGAVEIVVEPEFEFIAAGKFTSPDESRVPRTRAPVRAESQRAVADFEIEGFPG